MKIIKKISQYLVFKLRTKDLNVKIIKKISQYLVLKLRTKDLSVKIIKKISQYLVFKLRTEDVKVMNHEYRKYTRVSEPEIRSYQSILKEE